MNTTLYSQYLEACCTIAEDAGAILMRYFKGDFATQHKADESPVTDADIEANRFICQALAKLTPQIPVVAEEDESLLRGEHRMFWLVDPLDGTLSFIRREKEFTVNIALIKDRRPVFGAIYAPPEGTLYFGQKGKGAFRILTGGKPTAIAARARPERITVTRSRSKPRPEGLVFLQKFDVEHVINVSSAIKFCLVADGRADLYTRFGRTMEWDTAAGHAILEAAGGRVETVDGKPLLYGKPHFENPPFIAYGKR